MALIDTASPRTRGRIAGGVYLLYFVTAVLGAVVAPAISGLGGTSTDAAATAHYVVTHGTSVRVAFALGVISTAFYVALMVLFYRLFKPVSRTAALLALAFGLVGCAVTAFGSLFQVAPIVVLNGEASATGFDPSQLQGLANLFLNLGGEINAIALLFFGVFQLALGYLIFRSTFLPRFLGIPIALAGVGWFLFLAPPLAKALLTELEVLGFLAEASLMLWLLIVGVNAERWLDRVAASGAAAVA